jgi:hypothetical protein
MGALLALTQKVNYVTMLPSQGRHYVSRLTKYATLPEAQEVTTIAQIL